MKDLQEVLTEQLGQHVNEHIRTMFGGQVMKYVHGGTEIASIDISHALKLYGVLDSNTNVFNVVSTNSIKEYLEGEYAFGDKSKDVDKLDSLKVGEKYDKITGQIWVRFA